MTRRRPLRPLVAAVPAAAQAAPASMQATVSVAPPPILLESTRDLWFGNVGPGSVVAVPARPAYPAGTWSAGVRFGNLRKQIRYGITMTLPAELASGAHRIPVGFNGSEYGWMCIWNASTGTAGVCAVQDTQFNPTSHVSAPLVIDLPNNTPTNNVFAADIYLGGRITVPTTGLVPGLYSAPIRITIASLN